MPEKDGFRDARGRWRTGFLHRLLLLSFPSDFREAYADDLLQALDDAAWAQRDAGRIAALLRWVRVAKDMLSQGLAERWDRVRGNVGPVPPRRPGGGAGGTPWSTRCELALREVRLAARALAHRPGFTLAFVSILGLSLAGATTLWGTVYHVSMAPLGFMDEDALVRVWYRTRRASTDEDFGLSDGMLAELRDHATTLQGVGYVMIAGTTTVLDPQDAPAERVTRLRVSDDFFDILGTGAAVGRTFSPGDGEADVVVLSHGTWQRRFGGRPEAVGSSIRLGGTIHTVVGVLPEDFRWLDATDEPVEFWTAVDLVPGRFDPFFYFSVARLADDATLQSAEAEVEALFKGIVDTHFPDLRRRPARFATVRPLRDDFLGAAKTRIRVLSAALVLVALLGAVNISLLLLIRAVGRARESAIRFALGGGVRRAVAPLVAELGLLLLGSAAIALVLSRIALTTVRQQGAAGLVRADAIGMSLPVLGGGAVISVLVFMLALGTVALGLRNRGGRAVLQAMADSVTGGRLPRSVRAPLIVTQVAVSLTLVSVAVLLGRSFVALSQVDLGFDSEGVVTGSLTLPSERYWEPVPSAGDRALRVTDELTELHRLLRERLRAHPEVRDASLAAHAPLSGRYGGFTPFRPEWFDGPDGEMPGGRRFVSSNDIDPDFLRFLGVDLLEGRWFRPADDGDAPPVALVSRSLADNMWPEGDAVGSRYQGWVDVLDDEGRLTFTTTWITVIGVVEDLRQWGLREVDESVYRPLAQTYQGGRLVDRSGRGPRLRLFVRHGGDAGEAVSHMRSVAAELVPGVPLDDVRPLDELVGDQLREPRFYVTVFGAFGILALTLALGGIGAVVGYGVSRRKREIGLRLALGAWTTGLFRLVAAETLALTAGGIGIGLVLAYVGGRLLEGLLFDVPTHDPATLLGSSVLFAFMALAATLIPTRRALSVDPAQTLRHE